MIARTRKRPRVRSISLRTFGWVCAREAAFALVADQFPPARHPHLRLWLCKAPLAHVRRVVQRMEYYNPFGEH